MAQNNNIKEFYKAEIEPLGSFGSEQEFTEFISDPKNATDFFEAEFKEKGIFGSSDEFVDFIGVKKKVTTEPLQSGGTSGDSAVQSTESETGLFAPMQVPKMFAEKTLKVKETPAPKGQYTLEREGQKVNVNRDDIFKNLENEEFLKGVKSGEVKVDIQDDESLGNLLNEKLNFFKPQERYTIDGQEVSQQQMTEKLYDRDFVNKLQQDQVKLEFPETDTFIADLTQKQKQSGGELMDKWESIKAGFQDMAAGVAGLRSFVGRIARLIPGMEDLPMTLTEQISQASAEKLKKDAENTREKIRQYDEGFISAVKEGRYLDATNQVFNVLGESAPYMAGVVATQGLGAAPSIGIMGTVTASSELAGSKDLKTLEGKELTEAEKIGRASVLGGAEAVFGQFPTGKILSKQFPIVKEAVKSYVGKAAREGGEQAAKAIASNSARQTALQLGKELGIDYTKEVGGEVLTTLTENLTDNYLGVTDYSIEQLYDNAAETAAISLAMSGVMTSPTIAKGTKQIADQAIRKAPNTVKEKVKQQEAQGKITPEQSEMAITNLEKREKAINAVPNDLKDNVEVVDKIEEKQALEEEIKNLDPIFQGQVQEQINEKIKELETLTSGTVTPTATLTVTQKETTVEVKKPIAEMKGESVTVNLGGKAISGIVEVDEGGKAQIFSGNKIYELPADVGYSEYVSPVRLADNVDGIEVNGEVYAEVRFEIKDNQEVALLIKEDGTLATMRVPAIVEELKYQSALAQMEEMNEQKLNQIYNTYESERKATPTAEEGVGETDGTVPTETEQDIRLQEAIEEIDLIEQIALEQIEQAEGTSKLVQYKPKGSKDAKVYLVTKNADGSYSATVDGKKVVNKNVLSEIGKKYETTTKQEVNSLIPKLQEQTNNLKQEVENKLFGVTPKIEQDAKEQQSGQVREQSVQETTERTSDSDMPIVNEAELQDREVVEEEVIIEQPKLFEDAAEQQVVEERVAQQDNVEQEPIIESIERKAESDSETELNEAVAEADAVINQALDIRVTPISEITTDEVRFQNREGLNQEKVDDIANKWSDADQDPIHVWKDPKNGKVYVLSGHHRFAAAKQAGKTNVKTIDRTNDFTEEQAKRFAREEANANRTMETPLERAKIYRRDKEEGKSKKEIEEKAKRLEGKNANYILALASLNPKGKTINMLNVTQDSGDKQTQKEAEKIAEWVGEAKRRYDLTDAHENELFDALNNPDFSKRNTRKADFLQKVGSLVNTLDFNKEKPLNIQRFKEKTTGEQAYEKEVDDIKQSIAEKQTQIDELNARFTDPKRKDYVATTSRDYENAKRIADKKIAELNAQIKGEQVKLQELYQNKGKYLSAPTTANLFDMLDSLKIDGDQTGTLMLAPKLFNGFIDAIKAGIKAGMILGDAIKKGIDYLKANGVTDVEPYLNEIEINAKEPNLKREIQKLIKRKPTEQKRINKAYALGVADTKEVFKAKIAELRSDFEQYYDNVNQLKKDATDLIKSALNKDFISQRTFETIMNRLGKAKTPNQYQKLFDYISKAAEQADYAERMSEVSKLQSAAKKRNHTSMQKVVNDFVAINPELIPDNLLPQYIQALDELSGKVPSYATMMDIYYQVIAAKPTPKKFENVTTYNQAKELYDSIALNKVSSIEDYRSLFADINSFKRKINQLIENEIDLNIIQSYEDLLEQVGKDQQSVESKYASEITSLKTDMINELRKSMNSAGITNLSAPDKALLSRFFDLTNNDLRNLSPEELYNLQSIMDNVREDGYLDVFRLNPLVIKAENVAKAKEVSAQINKAKPFAKQFDDMTQTLKRLGATYSAFWESVLGLGSVNFGAFTKQIVVPMERAIASYRRNVNDGYKEYNNLKSKYKIKNSEMTKLGMVSAYLREYAMQFDPNFTGKKDADGNTFGTRDWFQFILSNENAGNSLTKDELASIREVWNAFPKVNGKVDLKAVYDSYMNNSTEFLTKNEMSFLKDLNKWKEENITNKQKYSNELRGKGFNEVLFHIKRIRKGETAGMQNPVEISESGNMRIAAGSGKDVTNNNMGAIEVDFEKIFAKSVEETARDFNITPMLQQQSDLLSRAEKEVKEGNKTYIKVARENLRDAINYEFERTKSELLERWMRNLMKAKAAQVLIAPIRSVGELFSSLVSYPLRSKEFGSYKEMFKKRDAVRKLMEITESPFLNKSDISKHFDVQDGEIKGKDNFSAAIEFFAAMPERLGLEPVWMASFTSDFLKQTGVEFDRKQFISDPSYAKKYKTQIENSAAVADANYSQIAGSTTQAGSRRFTKVAPERVAKALGLDEIKANTVGGQILSFFTNYPFREVEQGVKAARALVEVAGTKEYDYKDGLKVLMPVVGSFLGALTYQYSQAISYNLKQALLGDDDEKEKADEELKKLLSEEGILNESIAAVSSVGSTRYSGLSKFFIQTIGTIVYNTSENEKVRDKAKALTRDITFKNPFELKKKKDGEVSNFGLKEKIAFEVINYIPPLASAGDALYKWAVSLGGYEYIYKKIENGELLTEPEKELLVATQLFVNTANIIIMNSGGAVPFSNELNKYINKVKKEQSQSATKQGSTLEERQGTIKETTLREATTRETTIKE